MATKTFTYACPTGANWFLTVSPEEKHILVSCKGESREYEIKSGIKEVSQSEDKQYVYIKTKKGLTYQFKFEEDAFLVGDIYEGESYIKGFAAHIFGEEV